MRLVGIGLVALGALTLGAQSFGPLFRGPAAGADPAQERVEGSDRVAWVSPVVGGIAVVGGLLLLATDGRRD